MSLHARIAIGPSRRAILLERFVMLGGFALVVATCAARLSSPWPLLLGAVGLTFGVVASRRAADFTQPGEEFLVAARTAVEIHRPDPHPVEHHVLDEDSVLWSGLVVLRLVPATFSTGRARSVIAFDRDLAPADARHLRRLLLWISRGGARPDPVGDRSS